jgi:hypothetical protein
MTSFAGHPDGTFASIAVWLPIVAKIRQKDGQSNASGDRCAQG